MLGESEYLKAHQNRFKLLSGLDLSNAPPMRWLVEGVIPAEGLAALYGASGSGKSFLTLDMGCAIASGEGCWFGLKITKVPVIYVCLEGEAGIGKRVKAWSQHHRKPCPANLKFITQPFNLLSNDITSLADAVISAQMEGGLIILDTLNRAAPGADENSPVDMGKIILACTSLQRLIGGVILLVHHMGKDEAKKMRGHSSLPAALDGAIEITRTGNSRRWVVAKSKDDKDGDSYSFKLEVVNLGTDEAGGEIASCIVDFDSSNALTQINRIISPKAGNQKIIWEGVNHLLSLSKEYGKEQSPSGKPCIKLEDVIQQLHGSLTCPPKRQNERIRAAITGLINRGLLTLNEGWICKN